MFFLFPRDDFFLVNYQPMIATYSSCNQDGLEYHTSSRHSPLFLPAARRDARKRDGTPIVPRLLDPRPGTETESMNPPDRPTSGDRFDHPVLVEDADIDANGHANNVAYLRRVQQAAVAHWSAV